MVESPSASRRGLPYPTSTKEATEEIACRRIYIVNLYGNYKINDNVSLNLRAENLLDKNYEYYNGFGSAYPGRGRGIFGGVTIEW